MSAPALFHHAAAIANSKIGAGEPVEYGWLVLELETRHGAKREDARKAVDSLFDAMERNESPERIAGLHKEMERRGML